jgi:pyridoxamine 5'-phosphate oxidase
MTEGISEAITKAMTEAMPPWRPLLRAAMQREGRSVAARWLQLATTGLDGAPRVRTLVFRGWSGMHQLELFSDQRSEKVKELSNDGAAEVCWLFPKARQQYRLRGKVKLITATEQPELCQQRWQKLSDTGRAVWGWPTPADPLDPAAAFPEKLSETTPLPEHFVVVRLQVNSVERLNLGAHPHQRTRWSADTDWREQTLNP